MALNFPDSPTVNDTFTAGDRTWIWTGSVWNLVSSLGTLDGLSDVTITTPTTGQTITYNGTQWVNSAATSGFDPFLLMGA